MSEPKLKVPNDPMTEPGAGIRSVRSTNAFKIINFELYTKPNAVVMGIGIVCMIGCTVYIAYMRNKYKNLGFYSAVKEDGSELFVKKKSKWD